MTARSSGLVRVLRLMRLLQSEWCDLGALAVALSVSPRTIRRDLAAIEEAHMAVSNMRGDDDVRRWHMFGAMPPAWSSSIQLFVPEPHDRALDR